MEFWGVEVKPGQAVRVNPGVDKFLHLSQAAIEDPKKDKVAENVPLFVEVDDKKLVIGTLSLDKFPQIAYDLVFEKEFSLSHNSKSATVYFTGFKSLEPNERNLSDDFDSEDEDDDLDFVPNANGQLEMEEIVKPAKGNPLTTKADVVIAKPKAKTEDNDKDKVDDDDENEDEDGEDESDDDEDVAMTGDESDEEEDDEEDEATPKKVEAGSKRASGSASKTPFPEKKAKLVSPAGNQKTGDGKKGSVHVATPHPAKQSGKPPVSNSEKFQRKTPKSSAGSFSCKECSKTFNSENGLHAHSKAKHGK